MRRPFRNHPDSDERRFCAATYSGRCCPPFKSCQTSRSEGGHPIGMAACRETWSFQAQWYALAIGLTEGNLWLIEE